MDFLTIDPNFTQDCSVYDVSPIFILLGALVIIFAVLFLGYQLIKSPIEPFLDGYRKEKRSLGRKKASIGLVYQILKTWRPLAIILTLTLFAIIFAFNAYNVVVSLLQSGCI